MDKNKKFEIMIMVMCITCVILLVTSLCFIIGGRTGSTVVTPSNNTKDATVHVIGKGVVSVAPNTAKFDIIVKETRDISNDAADAVNEKLLVIAEILDRYSIGEDSREVVNANVFPEIVWDNTTNKQVITGYSNVKDITVTVGNLEIMPDLYDELSRLDIAVSPVEYSLKDKLKYKDLARTSAVNSARKQAEVYAKALGKKLGDAIAVSDIAPEFSYSIDDQELDTCTDGTCKAEGKDAFEQFRKNDIIIGADIDVIFKLK